MIFKGVKTAGSGVQKTGVAAVEVPFGAFVTRSASGTIKPTVTNVPYAYLGVAVDDVRKHAIDGFYSAGQKVPYIVDGTANVWILGGAVVNSSEFIRFPATLGAGTESLGVATVESTAATRTAYTIGRSVQIDDAGDTDYDQTVSSISGSELTIDSSADLTLLDLCEGDAIIIDSNEAAEFNRILDPASGTAKCTTVKTPLASHANSIKIYKLVQCEVALL